MKFEFHLYFMKTSYDNAEVLQLHMPKSYMLWIKDFLFVLYF